MKTIEVVDRDLACRMVKGLERGLVPISKRIVSESLWNAEFEFVIQDVNNEIYYIVQADVSKIGVDTGEPFEHSTLPIVFEEAVAYTSYKKKED